MGVVMAAQGYPDAPSKGASITGIPAETEDCITFHAGTSMNANNLTVTGGRVLCVVGLGDTVKSAQKHAYDAIEKI